MSPLFATELTVCIPPTICQVPSPLKNVVLVPPVGTIPVFAPPPYLNNVIPDTPPDVLLIKQPSIIEVVLTNEGYAAKEVVPVFANVNCDELFLVIVMPGEVAVKLIS